MEKKRRRKTNLILAILLLGFSNSYCIEKAWGNVKVREVMLYLTARENFRM